MSIRTRCALTAAVGACSPPSALVGCLRRSPRLWITPGAAKGSRLPRSGRTRLIGWVAALRRHRPVSAR